jgi:hypothetical protein
LIDGIFDTLGTAVGDVDPVIFRVLDELVEPALQSGRSERREQKKVRRAAVSYLNWIAVREKGTHPESRQVGSD